MISFKALAHWAIGLKRLKHFLYCTNKRANYKINIKIRDLTATSFQNLVRPKQNLETIFLIQKP